MKISSSVSVIFVILFSSSASFFLFGMIGSSLGYLDPAHGGFHTALFTYAFVFPIVLFSGIILLLACGLRWMPSVREKAVVYKSVVGIVATLTGLVVIAFFVVPWATAVIIGGPALIFGIMGVSALIAKKAKIGVKEIMILFLIIFLIYGLFGSSRWGHWGDLAGLWLMWLLPLLFIIWVSVSVGVSIGKR